MLGWLWRRCWQAKPAMHLDMMRHHERHSIMSSSADSASTLHPPLQALVVMSAMKMETRLLRVLY